MKLKVLVLIVSAGVLAAMGLFAAAAPAPSRADGPALREALFSRLGEWLGGEAAAQGPVRLEGFLNMRLEAENVEIKGVQRLGARLHIKLGKLSARLSWLDAIMGRPSFSDLRLENVTIRTDAPEGGGPAAANPLETASLAPLIDASRFGVDGRASPFSRIQIHGAQVALGFRSAESGRRQPHRRVKIADMVIRFSPDGSQKLTGNITWRKQSFTVTAMRGAPGAKLAGEALDLSVDSDLFTLAAAGELTTGFDGEPQFKGDVNVEASDASTAARWLRLGLPREWSLPRASGGAGDAFSVSGHIAWKKHEVSITHLEAALNNRSLSGALSVKSKPGGRVGFDGTLALSNFDLDTLRADASGGVSREGTSGAGGASGVGSRLASLLRAADADLRISVTRLSAGGVSGGAVALTLLAKDGRLSADLADMAVLGGRVRGHFALDSSQPQQHIVVRATAADLDSAQLSQAVNAPGWLTGGASVNVEAQADGSDWPGLVKSLNGEVDVSFSEGGSVGLDLFGIARRSGAGQREVQHSSRLNWARRGVMQFDTLRAELAIDQGRIRSKSFELSADGAAVAGRCVVDLPGQSIDWRFDVKPASALEMDGTAEGSTGALAAGDLAPSVTIKGPWRNPSIRVGEPGAEIDWPTGVRTHLPTAAPNG